MTDVADAPKKTTVSVTIDGRTVEAQPGQLLIAAAEDHGTYIPRFCWHPRMTPVGMCRQCLVEVEGPRGPMLVVSCMTPVAEGMVVDTENERVKKAQEGVLEFLLINHPLDCPVCDKGGECPLQDQAFSHGPGESRMVEEKRHYAKPIAISDLVLLDRERCILCDRCTRFSKEVAGDPLIHFVQRGNNTQVLTFPDEPFASYFSGNTVQICPVGALLAKPYRFKARPWDLDQRESTCTQCSVGCRITVQASRNELVRYQGVDVDPVNGGWLCDKGRFSFEAVNAEGRLSTPLARQGDELVPVSWGAAIDAAAELIRQAVADAGPGSVAVIGGARGTNEDAYAWAKLAKGVIGTPNTDAQLGDGLSADALLGVRGATIDAVCAASTILLIGIDLKEELPVLFLRVRDVVDKRKARLVEIGPKATGLERIASASLRVAPGAEAALVSALCDPAGTAPDGVDAAVFARAAALVRSGSVAVIVGRSNLAADAAYTEAALAAAIAGLPGAPILPVARRGNVLGALDAGLAPGVVPGRRRAGDLDDDARALFAEAGWAQLPEGGLDTRSILEEAAAGRIGALVLLGADPLADFPDADLARRALAGARSVISLDTHLSASSAQADLVLAAAAFGEKDGSTTNLEGRVSGVTQKVTPTGTARPDWVIAAELALALGADLGFATVSDVTDELARIAPSHAACTAAAVAGALDGVLASGPGTIAFAAPTVPAVPAADGYGFRLVVGRKLYDAGVGVAESASMSRLAPGARLHLNPSDVARLGVDDGTVVRVSSPRAALGLAVVADPGVLARTAWVAHNQPDTAVSELVDVTRPVTDVRVETVTA
jgi:NADH-quinone oxidoreductase subunit G